MNRPMVSVGIDRRTFAVARISILLVVVASVCFGQAPPFVSTNPSQILSAFQAARGNWVANIAGYANALFGALALIEFAWSAAVMVLEKADLQSWTAALVRKIMWIGGFYMLLINGPRWIPFIIDSFTQIGQTSSGVMSISPSNVFGQGLAVAGALSNGFSVAGFLTQPAVILALVFAAIIVVISYAMITIQFMVAMVESYIVVAAGFIFLGFGGSRWTAPYAERYIGLPVSRIWKNTPDCRELHRRRGGIHLPRLWRLPLDGALRRTLHRPGCVERRKNPRHLPAYRCRDKPRQYVGHGGARGRDIGIARNGRVGRNGGCADVYDAVLANPKAFLGSVGWLPGTIRWGSYCSRQF